MSGDTPEKMSEDMPEMMPEKMLEDMPDGMPDEMQEPKVCRKSWQKNVR